MFSVALDGGMALTALSLRSAGNVSVCGAGLTVGISWGENWWPHWLTPPMFSSVLHEEPQQQVSRAEVAAGWPSWGPAVNSGRPG